MKILINKTDKNILPITKIYDLGSVTTTINDLLNESTITLEKNITPILSIDGSNYLINNFNSTNIKEDFEAIITESDLISLGGGSSSGDFIPLSGTEPGSPVTGDLEMGDAVSLKINGLSGGSFYVGDIDITAMSVGEDGISIVSNNPNSKGLTGFQDYTPKITDLDYVQKKYVDEKVADSRPYKVYTALLTQTGTDAPVATVLENTLGYNIVWSRLNAGGYLATATEFATEDVNKFYCNIGNRLPSGASTDIVSYIVEASNLPVGSSSSFEVYTKTILNSTGVVTRGDNILEFTPIEIRVYN